MSSKYKAVFNGLNVFIQPIMTEKQIFEKLERFKVSLEGLSVGDAFGETFFVNPAVVDVLISDRALMGKIWRWTDDSLMAGFWIVKSIGITVLHLLTTYSATSAN